MSQEKMTPGAQFVDVLPHAKALGMQLQSMEGGRAEISMPYATHLIGDPDTGVIHGGAISALMDTCAGAAVMSHEEAGLATATLDLRIDYMRSATPGEAIIARAECYHVTRSIAFVRATAHDARADLPVATATATFTIERKA